MYIVYNKARTDDYLGFMLNKHLLIYKNINITIYDNGS